MRRKRLIWFFLMILVGLGLGLAYGWWINPVEYVNTSPDSLHPAYKADYVLMVAEIYHADGDLSTALQRLAVLGPFPPERLVADALLTARTAGYAEQDLALIEQFSLAVKTATVQSGEVDPTTTPGGQP